MRLCTQATLYPHKSKRTGMACYILSAASLESTKHFSSSSCVPTTTGQRSSGLKRAEGCASDINTMNNTNSSLSSLLPVLSMLPVLGSEEVAAIAAKARAATLRYKQRQLSLVQEQTTEQGRHRGQGEHAPLGHAQ